MSWFGRWLSIMFAIVPLLTAAGTLAEGPAPAGVPDVDGTVTLPKNLLLSDPVPYEDFETAGDWSDMARASNTSEFKTGTQSLKVIVPTAGGDTITTKAVNWNLSGMERLTIWYYLHDPIADYASSDGIYLYLATDECCERYFRTKIYGFKMDHAGWNFYSVPKGDFLPTGGPVWTDPIVRLTLQVFAASGKTPAVSFDDLRFTFAGAGKAAVLLRFDDGRTEQYMNAFPVMRRHNIHGTLYMRTGSIGASGYCTAAQLREMQAAGWVIGNGSVNGTDLSTLSEAQQEANLSTAKARLDGAGLIGGLYVAYPSGGYNANTDTAMAHLGMRTGHTTIPHTTQALLLPHNNLFHLQSTGITSGVSLATAKGYVDKAIADKTILPLHFRRVGDTGQMTTADFQALIEYIAAKARAGLITPITIDDLYRLTLGPVTVPSVR